MSVSRQAAKTVQLLADKVDIQDFFQCSQNVVNMRRALVKT